MSSPARNAPTLEQHLADENPVLVAVVGDFRRLDRMARAMGLLDRNQSLTMQVAWWPLISILGTFSSGKSSFVNHYLGADLQRTGNQAVDDKFTVICFGRGDSAHALPGVALDRDIRFPFYRISDEIERVAIGEGRRIDTYIQLKTCDNPRMRGKTLIDSPGFDADSQRDSTLRLTDYIIDLSDLVLVFFDARHPEPGAMRDTLDHLVAKTIKRADSGKFLYILNQIDTAANEDNPEDVVAAWQRALGDRGLSAGRFFTIYNPDRAVEIQDEAVRSRFEAKRDDSLAEIYKRMDEVEVGRAYRVVGMLEKTAREIAEDVAPKISTLLGRWRRRVLIADVLALIVTVVGVLAFVRQELGQDLAWQPLVDYFAAETRAYVTAGVAVLFLAIVHYGARRIFAHRIANRARVESPASNPLLDMGNAVLRSTRPWRPVFGSRPAGFSRRAESRLTAIREGAKAHIETLNDSFTNPSGDPS